ncbi:MAG: hypothetical protein IKS92_12020 [Victivallales bacterium]|nr:hypothetical protein [Victivallales bacterium]
MVCQDGACKKKLRTSLGEFEMKMVRLKNPETGRAPFLGELWRHLHWLERGFPRWRTEGVLHRKNRRSG